MFECGNTLLLISSLISNSARRQHEIGFTTATISSGSHSRFPLPSLKASCCSSNCNFVLKVRSLSDICPPEPVPFGVCRLTQEPLKMNDLALDVAQKMKANPSCLEYQSRAMYRHSVWYKRPPWVVADWKHRVPLTDDCWRTAEEVHRCLTVCDEQVSQVGPREHSSARPP